MQFCFFGKNLYSPNERARRVGHEKRSPSFPRSTYDFKKFPKVRKSNIRAINFNKNRVEILRHVTVMRGHNYVRFSNFGNFLKIVGWPFEARGPFFVTYSTSSFIWRIQIFSGKSKLHVLFKVSDKEETI